LGGERWRARQFSRRRSDVRARRLSGGAAGGSTECLPPQALRLKAFPPTRFRHSPPPGDSLRHGELGWPSTLGSQSARGGPTFVVCLPLVLGKRKEPLLTLLMQLTQRDDCEVGRQLRGLLQATMILRQARERWAVDGETSAHSDLVAGELKCSHRDLCTVVVPDQSSIQASELTGERVVHLGARAHTSFGKSRGGCPASPRGF